MERGNFDQPAQLNQEDYRALQKGELFRRAMIATEIRETIERSRDEKHVVDPRRRELHEEHGIAFEQEGQLLRLIQADGSLGEYLEHLEERRKLGVEEDIWAS